MRAVGAQRAPWQRQRAALELTYQAHAEAGELAARELCAYAMRCAVAPSARSRGPRPLVGSRGNAPCI